MICKPGVGDDKVCCLQVNICLSVDFYYHNFDFSMDPLTYFRVTSHGLERSILGFVHGLKL